MTDNKISPILEENHNITSEELNFIIKVNQKAIEIQSEVSKQNEDILETLEKIEEFEEEIEDKIDNIIDIIKQTNAAIKENIEKKVEDIEKNVFRLIIILTTTGIGTIINIIQTFMHK